MDRAVEASANANDLIVVSCRKRKVVAAESRAQKIVKVWRRMTVHSRMAFPQDGRLIELSICSAS